MAFPRIGISRCLLGDEVRYDGGHKRDSVLLDVLGPRVEWVPVCPEVEVGMGTPRELVELKLSGYILKKDSPSCGPHAVPVRHGERTTRTGRGLFAQALTDVLPNLPIEDEARLQDASIREDVIARVFAYDRFRSSG